MDSKTFIETLHAETSVTKKDISAILGALQNVLGNTCAEGDSVAVVGFGTFEPRKREERVVVMPTSGKRLLVPPKQVITFRPSTALRNSLQNEETATKNV